MNLKEKANCVRFGHSLWSANELPAREIEKTEKNGKNFVVCRGSIESQLKFVRRANFILRRRDHRKMIGRSTCNGEHRSFSHELLARLSRCICIVQRGVTWAHARFHTLPPTRCPSNVTRPRSPFD